MMPVETLLELIERYNRDQYNLRHQQKAEEQLRANYEYYKKHKKLPEVVVELYKPIEIYNPID